MLKQLLLTGAFIAPLFVAAPAQAADGNWFVRPGVTMLVLDDEIDLEVAGAPFPGAGMSTEAHFTPTVQVGRFITDNFAVSATLGLPPHIEIDGAGSIGQFGKLAETTYGPMTLTAQFHPISRGPVRPWVGAGAAYMLVFSTSRTSRSTMISRR
jgi:outer membrane protein